MQRSPKQLSTVQFRSSECSGAALASDRAQLDSGYNSEAGRGIKISESQKIKSRTAQPNPNPYIRLQHLVYRRGATLNVLFIKQQDPTRLKHPSALLQALPHFC